MIYYIFKKENGEKTAICGNTYIRADGTEIPYTSEITMSESHYVIDGGRCENIAEVRNILKRNK
jgi:hypothetical protein